MVFFLACIVLGVVDARDVGVAPHSHLPLADGAENEFADAEIGEREGLK